MTWNNFYKDKLNDKYLNYIKTKYSPYIEIVKSSGNSYLEIGGGIGSITKLIYDNLKSFIVTDKDPFMLKLSQINLKSLDVKIKKLDATKPFNIKADVIHSHGMLEHLSFKQIKQNIVFSTKNCKTLIHYVPSNKYTYKSFGDELLLSPNEWKQLVNPTEIIEFNKGYDLILIWRNK